MYPLKSAHRGGRSGLKVALRHFAQVILAVLMCFVGLQLAPASMASATASVCYVPQHKVSGQGTSKHPCNYNVHRNNYNQTLQYLNTRTYDSQGDSVLVNYIVGYVNTTNSQFYPYAPISHTALYVQVTHIWCLNPATHSVACQYLNITLVEHHYNKNYKWQIRCGTGQDFPCGFYAENGFADQGKIWSFGGGFFEDSTRHMTHWGGIAYLSGVVQGHYIPNYGYSLGSRRSAYWRATVHVHF